MVKKHYLILLALFFTGCMNTEIRTEKGHTVVFATLGDMNYVAEDSLYGNQIIKVPEITQSVMDDGGVLAFIERTAGEDRPQRWSQLPQYTLVFNTPVLYVSQSWPRVG